MLDIGEAAVRQRLGRARKQFQSFYEYENGEQIIGKTKTTNDTNVSQKRPPNHHSNIERAEVRFPG